MPFIYYTFPHSGYFFRLHKMLDDIIERLSVNDPAVWDTIANMDNDIAKLQCTIELHRGNTKHDKAVTRVTNSRLRAATNVDLLWKIIRFICVKVYAQNVHRLSDTDIMHRNTMVDSIAACYNILLKEVYDIAPISEWGMYFYLRYVTHMTHRRCHESAEVAASSWCARINEACNAHSCVRRLRV